MPSTWLLLVLGAGAVVGAAVVTNVAMIEPDFCGLTVFFDIRVENNTKRHFVSELHEEPYAISNLTYRLWVVETEEQFTGALSPPIEESPKEAGASEGNEMIRPNVTYVDHVPPASELNLGDEIAIDPAQPYRFQLSHHERNVGEGRCV